MRQVIDTHTHIAPIPWEEGTVSADSIRVALQVMDDNGIIKAVDLDGTFGERLRENLAQFRRHGAGRVVSFANLDYSYLNEPDFGKRAMALLEDARAQGAVGLKLFKQVGLDYRDREGRFVRLDDPRFDPVWTKAGELEMPVLIHVADPAAFFRPPTPDNERYEELQVHPEWSFYGDQFPPREALLTQFVNIMLRHPETTFIGPHFGNNPENPRWVAAVMRRCPNFTMDISARLGEIGRHDPATLREFFIEFQDRIMFGTDTVLTGEHIDLGVPLPESKTPEEARVFYDIHWKFFETNERDFDHPSPIQGRWKINAIGLPPDVLEKVYRGNAERLIDGLA